MGLLLIDGNNLFMRAWHATRHESMTSDDESTATLVVFSNTLLRHIREEKPERVVVCWDGGGSSYRLRLLPSYKGTRVKHMSLRTSRERILIKTFLSLAGVFQMERSGVEADDLIAKYWHDAQEPVVLVSEDKDFLQIVGPNPQGHDCQVLRSTGERWDTAKLMESQGVTPQHIPLVMALTGDTSDNVPGVPGIGPVKAQKLLEESGWSLEAIEHPEVRQRLSQVLLNHTLVNLRLPLPGLAVAPPPVFEPTRHGGPLYDGLIAFLEDHQLKGLLSKTLSGTLWGVENSPA